MEVSDPLRFIGIGPKESLEVMQSEHMEKASQNKRFW
jgi:hypothetical protein